LPHAITSGCAKAVAARRIAGNRMRKELFAIVPLSITCGAGGREWGGVLFRSGSPVGPKTQLSQHLRLCAWRWTLCRSNPGQYEGHGTEKSRLTLRQALREPSIHLSNGIPV
jgi:hypothetical protein